MRFLWAVLALLFALLNIYVAYLFIAAAISPRLSQKGILLQAPPLVGGVALAVLALPLIWNALRLAVSKPPA